MSRAFDTIDRGILLKDLKNLIKPDILHLINVLLTDVKIQVKHKNKLGNIFTPDIGSPQGDCASPIWFIFYLHLAIVEIKQKVGNPRDSIIDIKHDHTYSNISKKVKTPKGQHQLLIDQQYADDISWATENKEVKDSIKEEAPPILRSKNLIANDDKTEDYEISRNSSQEWRKCKLVGTLLGNAEDINRRKQLACAAFAKNKPILCSKRISLNIRLRIFIALIASIFLYNAELWTLSHKAKVKIDTFQRKFLRQIVKSKWIKNSVFYKQCKTIPWSVTIKQKRLNWFGHLNRLPDQAPAKIAFKEALFRPPKKLRGGQPLNWLHTIKRDFKEINISLEEAIKLTKDRQGYKGIVDRAMAKSLNVVN